MNHARSYCFLLLLAVLYPSSGICGNMKADKPGQPKHGWEDEIFYQIFPRSFYDSNGDGIGDFNGIREKLDYLQELGVTAIWTTPILKARCYHNYYVDSFDSLDPAFGTWDDWIGLVKDMHRRGMKIFLDMEPQYVTDHHPWYLDSYKNPSSKYSAYLWYEDSLNEKIQMRNLGTYNKDRIGILPLRMNNPQVLAAVTALFRKFADPNGDGKFDDGVDGFRIDHMMDDLDHRGKSVNLNATFWKPLFDDLRKLNPDIFFVAEQADWGFGADALTKGDADGVFAFPEWWGTTSFSKKRLLGLIDTTWMKTPPGKHQFTFIENHDVDRYASQVGGDPGKERIGAALNIFLKGIPTLYYGQEIGMRGKKGQWRSDGNDIPLREAFKWNKSASGKGMALWYANSGVWWDQTNLHPDDGTSLEEEIRDSSSLWYFYKNLIGLRTNLLPLRRGEYVVCSNNNDSVVSFGRECLDGEQSHPVVVILNLSPAVQNVVVQTGQLHRKVQERVGTDEITGKLLPEGADNGKGSVSLVLSPYEVVLIDCWRVKARQ
jgi:glycosidase